MQLLGHAEPDSGCVASSVLLLLNRRCRSEEPHGVSGASLEQGGKHALAWGGSQRTGLANPAARIILLATLQGRSRLLASYVRGGTEMETGLSQSTQPRVKLIPGALSQPLPYASTTEPPSAPPFSYPGTRFCYSLLFRRVRIFLSRC